MLDGTADSSWGSRGDHKEVSSIVERRASGFEVGRRLRLAVCTGLAVAVSVGSLPGEAQQAAKTGRVGFVGLNPTLTRERAAFLQGMRDLGYVEGRNVVIEYRFAEGDLARLPALTAELVALKVDVIVAAGGSLGVLAAKQATTTIPIVFPAVGDPAAEGLVASLARPGGNATGLAVLNTELIGKRLELARQLVPHVSRAAFLLKPDAASDSTMKSVRKSAEEAARSLRVRLQIVEARGPDDFERAFADMTRAGASVLIVHSTPAFDREAHRLAALALRHRLPTVYSFRHNVDAGGLMSYGPDLPDLFRRSASYVDRVLKGASPADLPVEQPTKFELVINLKTAKALGLKVSPSTLAQADDVIER